MAAGPHPPAAPTGVSAARQTLQAAGLKATATRVAVLRALARRRAPASHAEVAQALAPAGIGRATVFRNLVDMVGAGLVSRADHGDHVWRFALRAAGPAHAARHPHLICRDCGERRCMPRVAVALAGQPGDADALRDAEVEVRLHGQCDRCTAGSARPAAS